MSDISAVIITFNEEKKLKDCLDSLSFANEIIVIDSNSADRTVQIAKDSGAKVISRQLDDFSSQKNFGISQARHGWILLIDADERVSGELKNEILEAVNKPSELVGYEVKRENYIFKSRVRFGASIDDRQLRLIKKGKGLFQGLVHERIVPSGPVGLFENPLRHITYQNLDEYFSKFNVFTSLDAKEMVKQGLKVTWFDVWVKPVISFVYFYFFKFGFLDGKAGLVYQGLSSYYIFVRSNKVLEYRRSAVS